jgi:hypothetical protein
MTLSATQKLILIELIFSGEEPTMGFIKPVDRTPLLKGGYIELEKRGRTQHILLTDRAWAWARDDLRQLELKKNKAERTVDLILRKLGAYLDDRQLTLVDLLKPRPPSEQIRRAYLAASGGALKTRVRLSDLRSALPQLERKVFDRALMELFETQQISLFPLDNPREIRSSDERDAFNLSGIKQHVVYLEA